MIKKAHNQSHCPGEAGTRSRGASRYQALFWQWSRWGRRSGVGLFVVMRTTAVLAQAAASDSETDVVGEDSIDTPGSPRPSEPKAYPPLAPSAATRVEPPPHRPQETLTEPPARPLSVALNRHLELSIQMVAPAQAFLSSAESQEKGIYTQPMLGVTVGGRVLDHLFVRGTLWGYPDQAHRADWTPDFTWSAGWDDWRPWRLFLVHDSYSANRLPWRATPTHPAVQLLKDSNTLGFHLEVPRRLRDWLRFSPNLWLGADLACHYSPEYDVYAGPGEPYQTGTHQLSGELAVNATWREHLFVSARFYYWPKDQQPWDPDFAYAFGYQDWRPWSVSLRWQNYSGNRFWFHSLAGLGGVDKGALVASFRLGF